LRDTPDGFGTKRVYADLQDRWVWNLDAGGYVIEVKPDFECGFDEEGDGKVLTAITQRVAEMDSLLMLTTVQLLKTMSGGQQYTQTVWYCTVMLGQDCRQAELEFERRGSAGSGRSGHPGTAALLAYLRAWGTVSQNLGLGEG
jgi:hypothetical protein